MPLNKARQTLVHLAAAAALLGAQPASRVMGEAATAVSSEGRLTLRDGGGAIWAVQLAPDASVLLVEPGAKDLTGAVPVPTASVKPGDRLLVRGELDQTVRAALASSLIVMSKDAVEAAKAREQAEWRAKSLAGTVVSVDAATASAVLRAAGGAATREWKVVFPADAVLLRYADDSIRFADARPAKLADVRPGDQMRLLGEREPEAGTAVAREVLFGSFRTLGGEITRVDAEHGIVTLRDVQTRKPVALKINGGANLRRMPSFPGAVSARPGMGMGMGMGMRGGEGPGNGGPRRPDLQQMLDRLPALTLADLKPGDAVIVSAGRTSGPQPWSVVSLVSGVDALLRAPAAQVNQTLGNWSMEAPMQ
jgi:hypothetical protein